MTALSVKDAISIYAGHREAILKMWNFYSVVTLAVVAWALGGKEPLGEEQRIWAVVGYTIFACGNAVATVGGQIELRRMALALVRMAASAEDIQPFLSRPIHPALFVIFYVAVTIVIDVAIARSG